MRKTKKVMSLLLMSAMLVANVPLVGVNADDVGGTESVPVFEIQAEVIDGEMITRAEVDSEEVSTVTLEFENERRVKDVVYMIKESDYYAGSRGLDSFVDGGNYRLVRVFGTYQSGDAYSITAEEIGKETTFSIDKELVFQKGNVVVGLDKAEYPLNGGGKVSVKLPYSPYRMRSLKVFFKYMGKVDGDGFADNYGMHIETRRSYDENTDSYISEFVLGDHMPFGEYVLTYVEVEDWDSREFVIYDGLGGLDFSNVRYKYSETVVEKVPEIVIKDVTDPVKYNDIVKLEIAAENYKEAVDKIVVTYEDRRDYPIGTGLKQYTLTKNANGKFTADIYIHKYLEGGKHSIELIEVYNKDGDIIDVIGSNGNIGNGTINIDEVLTVDGIEFGVTTDKKVYDMGEKIKFSLAHNMTGLEHANFSGTVQLINLDSDKTGYGGYAKFYWDAETSKFVVRELYTRRSEEGYFEKALEPGRYTVAGISLSADYAFKTEKPDLIFEDGKVLFTVKSPIELGVEELEKSENAVDQAKYILELIKDEGNGELKEKYMAKVQEIITESKALESVAVADAPRYVFKPENLKSLNIEEALNEDVEGVVIRLDSQVLPKEELDKYNADLGDIKNIIGLYNLSLMKDIIMNTNEMITSKVANEDIRGMLTLRIPVPEGYLDIDNLRVVYINDLGVIEELETVLVEEGGIKYLEFKTNHFSVYGVMELAEGVVDEEPVDEEPVKEEPVKEEPVKEEPVKEEPVKEEPVKEEPVKEEVVEKDAEKDKEKEEDKLPEAGVGSTLGYSLSGILFSGAGLVLLRKKETEKE